MKSGDFNVSIIIPVYNVSEFLVRAVKSALVQNETKEIILIEDGSTDNSYSICERLENEHEQIFLYTHDGRANKGAAASRNLGIEKARNEYIAFLDADDFFLEKRFDVAKQQFITNSDADGVYEAIGVYFESENARLNWRTNPKGKRSITTIRNGIKPKDLFWEQAPIGPAGTVHLDGLTVKKAALEKVGLFDPDLRLHQDTELLMRLAMACRLYPGNTESPVALRGVHDNNRITKKRSYQKKLSDVKKMYESTYTWAKNSGFIKESTEIKRKIKFLELEILNSDADYVTLVNFLPFFKVAKKHPETVGNKEYYYYLSKYVVLYLSKKIGLIKLKRAFSNTIDR